jgi:hypothetical protein
VTGWVVVAAGYTACALVWVVLVTVVRRGGRR